MKTTIEAVLCMYLAAAAYDSPCARIHPAAGTVFHYGFFLLNTEQQWGWYVGKFLV